MSWEPMTGFVSPLQTEEEVSKVLLGPVSGRGKSTKTGDTELVNFRRKRAKGPYGHHPGHLHDAESYFHALGQQSVKKALSPRAKEGLILGGIGAAAGAAGGVIGNREAQRWKKHGYPENPSLAYRALFSRKTYERNQRIAERRQAKVKKDSPASPDLGTLKPLPGVRRKKRGTP